MQELESVYNLYSGTVLEGQEVSNERMDPGKLQLMLQLVRRKTLRVATPQCSPFQAKAL